MYLRLRSVLEWMGVGSIILQNMRMYDKERGKYAPLRCSEPAVPGRGDIIINCFTTAIILTFDPLAAEQRLCSLQIVSATVAAAVEDFVKIVDKLN